MTGQITSCEAADFDIICFRETFISLCTRCDSPLLRVTGFLKKEEKRRKRLHNTVQTQDTSSSPIHYSTHEHTNLINYCIIILSTLLRPHPHL
jgi:hypothetical protein